MTVSYKWVVHLGHDTSEMRAIFVWCTGVKTVRKCSYMHELVATPMATELVVFSLG